MSLQTWKEEYYKVEAKDVPVADALDHSILKWTGLLRENLERHGLRWFRGRRIEEIGNWGESLTIDGGSCALCVHFIPEDRSAVCSNCPIVKYRGGRCDQESETEELNYIMNPFRSFSRAGNAKPMLDLLLETKKHVERTDNQERKD